MYTLRMRTPLFLFCRNITVITLSVLLSQQSYAWGKYGHQMIDQLAVGALPSDVPAFLRSGAARDAVGYYAPEPDRWGSPTEPELRNAQEPDHFLSMEWSDVLKEMPRDRYDYVRALAIAQAAHPELTLKAEDVGTQPYQTNELWQRLKSSMREYRRLVAANEDTKPVEAEIIFFAGWLGHYVGDGAQPLHTSYRYNGWLGDNPNGYTTEHRIHSQFESGFIQANIKEADVAPLIPIKPELVGDVFTDYMVYLRRTHTLYQQVYEFEKAGALSGNGTAASRQFAAERLAAGATELRDLIYTAWIRSGDPMPQRGRRPTSTTPTN